VVVNIVPIYLFGLKH